MRTIWTRLALQDLEKVYEFISNNNPKAAIEIIKKIEEGVEHLKSYPNMGRKGRLRGTRELAIPNTPFFISYTAKETHVEILAFLPERRKWP